MEKITIYTYLGTNGTLSTPIHLEGIYSVKNYKLIADNGYVLTKNGIDMYKTVTVNENDIINWTEVPDNSN